MDAQLSKKKEKFKLGKYHPRLKMFADVLQDKPISDSFQGEKK